MSEEVWKEIPSPYKTSRVQPHAKVELYDLSMYEASNLGNVRNKHTKHVLSKKARGKKREYSHVGLSVPNINGKKHSEDFKLSRIIAHTFIKNPQDKPYVDHINRNKKDDRVVNLRWVTQRENTANQGPRRGRKYKGVYRRSYHNQDGTRVIFYVGSVAGHYVGSFYNEEEAAKAVDFKSKELYGHYAVLNYEN